MVPGDIYIGKETLVQYVIYPTFAGDYDGPDDIVVDHEVCGAEVARFDDYYLRKWTNSSTADLNPFTEKNPWDILGAILKHEKECSKKCPRVVSPAEDSSMTNAEMQQIKDAAVATGKYREVETSEKKEIPVPLEIFLAVGNRKMETPEVNPNVL